MHEITHPELLGFLRRYADSLPRNSGDYNSAHETLGRASEDYVEKSLSDLKYAASIKWFRRMERFSPLDKKGIDFIVGHLDNKKDFLQITSSPDTAWNKERRNLQLNQRIFVISTFDCYRNPVPLPIIEQLIMDWHDNPESARRDHWDYLTQPDFQSFLTLHGKRY